MSAGVTGTLAGMLSAPFESLYVLDRHETTKLIQLRGATQRIGQTQVSCHHCRTGNDVMTAAQEVSSRSTGSRRFVDVVHLAESAGHVDLVEAAES